MEPGWALHGIRKCPAERWLHQVAAALFVGPIKRERAAVSSIFVAERNQVPSVTAKIGLRSHPRSVTSVPAACFHAPPKPFMVTLQQHIRTVLLSSHAA